MEAATVITNNDGMSQPNTIPTCPPTIKFNFQYLPGYKLSRNSPEANGKEKVDETEATTPIIEKANATVSISCWKRR